MLKNNTNFINILSILLLIFLLAAIIGFFWHNASSGILGKDEALYITLAKGHYSQTPIDTPPGNWLDAIEKGTLRTGDPPGFFLLLHYWEYISYSETWLRLLPSLFFLIGIFTLIQIGRLLNLPLFFCVLLGFLPLASVSIVEHAMEIRGYGMELCFTYLIIYSALSIITLINKDILPDKKKWIVFTLIMVLGLSSRLSFVITSSALFSVLWLCIFYKYKTPNFIKYFSPLAISSIISLLFFIFFFCMKYFFPSENAFVFTSAIFNKYYAIPGTFFNKIIYFFKQLVIHLPNALFGGSDFYYGAPFFKFLLFLTIIFILFNIIQKNTWIKIRANLLLYYVLFLFPLLAIFLSVFLAFLDLFPFSIDTRLSLYLLPAIHLFIIGLLKLFLDTEKPLHNNLSWKKLSIFSLAFIFGLLALNYGLLFSAHKVSFRMGGAQRSDLVIQKAIPANELKDIDYWYISIGEANSFKYHILHGNLKNKLSPHAEIIIENRPVTLKKAPIDFEIRNIYNKASIGNKIVMVLGHVDKKEAKEYTDVFSKYFPKAKYGKHEKTNEQVCYAIR